ncbi:CPBP family intramembrane glutamic endopeptidase [Haloplanus sp. GCM10025708]|uniref:CPBP family intramembrane glutamic endopeptidase n=1 Tax=Haloferacaceae TaxID=1644056 RepID=UPI0036088855
MLARILWNADERRPRAFWRVALLVVLVLSLSVGVGVGVGVVGVVNRLHDAVAAAARPALADVAVSVFGMGVVAGSVVAAVVVAGRFVDNRRLSDLGVSLDRDWWVDFAFGLALGAALLTLVFLVELAAGWVRVTGTLRPRDGFLARFLGLTVVFLFVGVYEELLARGYVLTNAAEGLAGYVGDRAAVAVAVCLSSALFGLAHANNPNATLVSSLAVTLAGVMLALGYVLTGEIAIPVGLHVTWNLVQGGVYGFPVSGIGVDVTVVAVEQRGPAVLTGGQFGPEAGLLGVAAVCLGAVAIAAWARYRYGRLRVHPDVTSPDLRRDSR